MTSHSPIAFSPSMNVPTLPLIVQRLSEFIESPECGTAEVGELIGQDPALTAKVLLLVNSAVYGLPEHCKKPQQACTILGLRTVRSLVVHAALIQEYERLEANGHDLRSIWRRAPLVGGAATMIARCVRGPAALRGDEAFLAGLLHDIGQLILLDTLGDRYVAIRATAQSSGQRLEAVEGQELSYTHSEVGARAIEAWGFGDRVRDAVAQHHSLQPRSPSPLATVVLVANAIVELLEHGRFTQAIDTADTPPLVALGITRNKVAEVVEHFHAQMHGAAGGIRAPLSTPRRGLPTATGAVSPSTTPR